MSSGGSWFRVRHSPYAPIVLRSSIALALGVSLLVAACTETDELEIEDPGRLVVWTAESIGVLVDGEISEIETEGAISQVAAADNGTLVWTSLTNDPFSVAAVIEGDDRFSVPTPTVPFFYHWSPDASRVAFLGNAPSATGLMFGLIDVEAQDLMSVESPPPFFLDWSPEGDRVIAHVGGAQLRIIDADTGDVQALQVDTGAFPTPIWDDRGIVIAVSLGPTVSSPETPVSFQTDISEIVLIDPDDGSRRVLTEVSGPVRLYSGAGGLALVLGEEGAQRIDVVGWDGGDRTTLGEGTIDLTQWSPDGTMLLWTERGGNGSLIPMVWDGEETSAYERFRPNSGFVTSYLPFWDQYDRSIWLWSGDSTAFALPTRDGIVVHGVDGDSETLPGWDMAIWATSPGDR